MVKNEKTIIYYIHCLLDSRLRDTDIDSAVTVVFALD